MSTREELESHFAGETDAVRNFVLFYLYDRDNFSRYQHIGCGIQARPEDLTRAQHLVSHYRRLHETM